MIDLTTEQRYALEGPGPAEVRDPVTNETYVLIRKVTYERIRSLLNEDADWAEGAYRAAMEVFARDGWDDPRMDVYDALDPQEDVMNVQRADVVLVDFPFPSGAGSKVRPALVIQNDLDNARLINTILTQITGTTHRALEATQVLVEIATPAGRSTGLAFDSVINCVNLATVDKNKVLRKLGVMPDVLMQKVHDAVRAALDLP